MAEDNPLVDDHATDDPVNVDGVVEKGDGWLAGTGIWKDTADWSKSINQGDLAGEILGGVTVGIDVISAVMDPIGTAASMLVGWMIEHIQPLKETLDALAGDAGVIKGRAATWHNISTALDGAAKDYAGAGVSQVSDWKGASGDAYRAHAKKLSEALGGTANIAEGTSGLVTVCGQGCATVRQMIHMLISQLVGKLISWAAEELASLGFATPVVVAQALAEIAKVSAKVAKLVERILDLIKTLADLAGKVVGFLTTIEKILAELPSIAKGTQPVQV